MTGLLLGTVLALAAVAYVALPLLRPSRAPDETPETGAPSGGGRSDPAEALIARYRRGAAVRPTPACPVCGPRPEPDALYCSSCGVRLAAGE